MVKQTKCFLYEPDNFVNIKGFVLCMHTKYIACIQICTKCFASVQNSCAHTNLLRKKTGFASQNLTSTSVPLNILYVFCVLRHIAFVKVFFIYHRFISE